MVIIFISQNILQLQEEKNKFNIFNNNISYLSIDYHSGIVYTSSNQIFTEFNQSIVLGKDLYLYGIVL